MALHWHAFGYNGSGYPPDSEAKNPQAPVRPLSLAGWFSKPASMRRGTFTDPDAAHDWLAAELHDRHPDPERLPAALDYYRAHLKLGQDAYAGGYTRDRAGIYVRALLTCPRTGADRRAVRCPERPA